MWDTVSLKLLGPALHDHESPVSGVAFSPDGHNLASIDKGGVIKLWDVASRQPLCNLCREAGFRGMRIAFSADGKSLLTWVATKCLSVFNLTFIK
jgi:WD40 repeat protein